MGPDGGQGHEPSLPFPLHTACQSLSTDSHTVSSAASSPAVEKHLERTRGSTTETRTQSRSSFQLVFFHLQTSQMLG